MKFYGILVAVVAALPGILAVCPADNGRVVKKAIPFGIWQQATPCGLIIDPATVGVAVDPTCLHQLSCTNPHNVTFKNPKNGYHATFPILDICEECGPGVVKLSYRAYSQIFMDEDDEAYTQYGAPHYPKPLYKPVDEEYKEY